LLIDAKLFTKINVRPKNKAISVLQLIASFSNTIKDTDFQTLY